MERSSLQLDEKMEHYARLLRNHAAAASGAETGPAAEEAGAAAAAASPRPEGMSDLTRHEQPLTRAQKEAVLACTNWESAHGHDAADAAFKAKIAAQLEDDSVTGLDLLETFAMWAADCTGDTAEAWTEGDRVILSGLDEIFSPSDDEAGDGAAGQSSADLTPQTVAHNIVTNFRHLIEKEQNDYVTLPFHLPCLRKSGYFPADLLTHGLMNHIFWIGMRSDGTPTRIHGLEASPIVHMLHDIAHATSLLNKQWEVHSVSAHRALNLRALPFDEALVKGMSAFFARQDALLMQALDTVHEHWRATNARVPMTGLFWMLHEGDLGGYPLPHTFEQGLPAILATFVQDAQTAFQGYFARGDGTSFLTGKPLDHADMLQRLVAKTHAENPAFPADGAGATLTSDGWFTHFKWKVEVSEVVEDTADRLLTVHNSHSRTDNSPSNRLLRGELEDANSLLAWARPPYKRLTPKMTGDAATDEAAWNLYKTHTLRAIETVLDETGRAMRDFFGTDAGKMLAERFLADIQARNAELHAELARLSAFLDGGTTEHVDASAS